MLKATAGGEKEINLPRDFLCQEGRTGSKTDGKDWKVNDDKRFW